jgi:hypothetical protein
MSSARDHGVSLLYFVPPLLRGFLYEIPGFFGRGPGRCPPTLRGSPVQLLQRRSGIPPATYLLDVDGNCHVTSYLRSVGHSRRSCANSCAARCRASGLRGGKPASLLRGLWSARPGLTRDAMLKRPRPTRLEHGVVVEGIRERL